MRDKTMGYDELNNILILETIDINYWLKKHGFTPIYNATFELINDTLIFYINKNGDKFYSYPFKIHGNHQKFYEGIGYFYYPISSITTEFIDILTNYKFPFVWRYESIGG